MELVSTANVPTICYHLIVGGLATLHELQTVYGLEDAYDLQEILIVRNTNDRIMNPQES